MTVSFAAVEFTPGEDRGAWSSPSRVRLVGHGRLPGGEDSAQSQLDALAAELEEEHQ